MTTLLPVQPAPARLSDEHQGGVTIGGFPTEVQHSRSYSEVVKPREKIGINQTVIKMDSAIMMRGPKLINDKVDEIIGQLEITRIEKGESSVGAGKFVKESESLCDAMLRFKEADPLVNTRDSGSIGIEKAQIGEREVVLLEAKISEDLTMKDDSTHVDIGVGKEAPSSINIVKDFSKVVDEDFEAVNDQIPAGNEGYPINGDDVIVQDGGEEQQQRPIHHESDCEKETRGCEGEKDPDYWSDSEVHKQYTEGKKTIPQVVITVFLRLK
ncbi:Hypothetical predicted protein [Olea europaea subsp. europaea]|uniref:Uncharacterized protein n=1 Tax=Olea europaea subsp. europaea TaxID=158383 RepID=A0A8S0PSR8_OLEEU|nr:Hypothetical predicted protein [Olea europaea subsp. europaea]